MAEPPCPARRQGPTGGRGRWGPGCPPPPPEDLEPKPRPLFSSGSLLAPGAQARPIWPRPLPPIFPRPFSVLPSPFRAPTPRRPPMRRAGEKTRMGAVLQAAKTGRQDQGRDRPVSSLQARAGVSVPRPGTPGPQAGARTGSPPKHRGKKPSPPRPKALSWRPGFPSLPSANPGQRKNRGPGAKGWPSAKNRSCPPLGLCS